MLARRNRLAGPRRDADLGVELPDDERGRGALGRGDSHGIPVSCRCDALGRRVPKGRDPRSHCWTGAGAGSPSRSTFRPRRLPDGPLRMFRSSSSTTPSTPSVAARQIDRANRVVRLAGGRVRADQEEPASVWRDAERECVLHERPHLARHDVQTAQRVSGVEDRIRLAAALQEQLAAREPHRQSDIPARDGPSTFRARPPRDRDDPDLDPAPLGGFDTVRTKATVRPSARHERLGGISSNVLPAASIASHVRDQIGLPTRRTWTSALPSGSQTKPGVGRRSEHARGTADRRENELEPAPSAETRPYASSSRRGDQTHGRNDARARHGACPRTHRPAAGSRSGQPMYPYDSVPRDVNDG